MFREKKLIFVELKFSWLHLFCIMCNIFNVCFEVIQQYSN